MKILYGVPGEGMGHATRSKVIISHLLKNHDVRVVSSSRAFSLLHDAFHHRVYEIQGFHLVFKNSTVSKYNTVKNILKTGPSDLIKNFRNYKKIYEEFKPDLVISDFESFSYFVAKLHDIPIISIDNNQATNRLVLDIPIPESESNNFIITKNIVKSKVPKCNYYLVSSFFPAEVRKKKTEIVPPILRDEIIKAKITKGKHVLVYLTSSSQENIIDILNQLKHDQFLVYGFNKSEQLGNVKLMPFSETEFIKNLASAKAVIANGGYSLISEAVYLHKPVFSVPLKGQFEQYVNAAYIEKLGYGKCHTEFAADPLKSFMYDIDFFTTNLLNYKQDGNQFLFKKLDEIITQVISDIV